MDDREVWFGTNKLHGVAMQRSVFELLAFPVQKRNIGFCVRTAEQRRPVFIDYFLCQRRWEVAGSAKRPGPEHVHAANGQHLHIIPCL